MCVYTRLRPAVGEAETDCSGLTQICYCSSNISTTTQPPTLSPQNLAVNFILHFEGVTVNKTSLQWTTAAEMAQLYKEEENSFLKAGWRRQTVTCTRTPPNMVHVGFTGWMTGDRDTTDNDWTMRNIWRQRNHLEFKCEYHWVQKANQIESYIKMYSIHTTIYIQCTRQLIAKQKWRHVVLFCCRNSRLCFNRQTE